jgi:hypothetical protein
MTMMDTRINHKKEFIENAMALCFGQAPFLRFYTRQVEMVRAEDDTGDKMRIGKNVW